MEESLKKHYSLWKWDATELGSPFKDRIRKCVGDISVHDNESCANAVEFFNFNERQAKFIVNSVRAYEFFEFQWRLPLWDAELIDFFLQVPISYRLNQLLYRKYAQGLFSQQLQPLSKIECTTDISSNSESVRLSAGLTRKVSYIWEYIFDVKWGCYFRFSFLSNLYFARIFDVMSLKGYPVMRHVVLNLSNAKHLLISLNGYTALQYLQKQIKD